MKIIERHWSPLEHIALCALDCVRTHSRAIFPFGTGDGVYGVWIEGTLYVGSLEQELDGNGIPVGDKSTEEIVALLVTNWKEKFGEIK